MALKQMDVPKSPKLYTKKYQGLLGVDYSCDVTEVDPRRTPTGTNMISDEGANPVKRLGWRVVDQLTSLAGEIKAMATMENETSDDTIDFFIFILAEHGIYRMARRNSHIDDTITRIFPMNPEDMAYDIDGTFTYFGGKLYAFVSWKSNGNLVGTAMLEMSQTVSFVNEPTFHIPEVTFNLKPNGTGGVSLEGVNLLEPKRIFSYQGNSNTWYYLYPKAVRKDPRYRKIVDDIKVEVLQDDGTGEFGWVTLTEGTDYEVFGRETVTLFNKTKEAVTGSVINNRIHLLNGAYPADADLGSDNVRITFTPAVMLHTYDPTVYDGIYKPEYQALCTTKATEVYGHTTADRVFATSGTEANKIYYSAVNDITYFPDTNWLTAGYDTNDIQGLVRVSDFLGVIKSDSIYDNTLYLIRGSFLDDNMVFTVVPSSAKLGAISPKSIMTLINEPLYLSRSGVFGIASVFYSDEKEIKNRSRFVDRKLVKEPNLENACAVVWNKYYLLCVNDHCYILDGRKSEYDATGNTTQIYEAYYWENIPAQCFVTFKDELYFAASDGRICKFNTDVDSITKYCDNGIEVWTEGDNNEWTLTLTDVNGDDEVVATPIVCEWSTPLDDDGSPQYFKTLNKKGNLVTLLPQERSSAKVTLNKDGESWEQLETFYVDIFDWGEVYFDRFPFSSSITARDDYFKKKVKKYKRLQITIKNDAIFEPFGILGITKTYTYGNFAK